MSNISSDEEVEAPGEPVTARRFARAAEERDRLLDAAAGAVREVASAPVPRTILLQYLLATVLPDEPFVVRLGAVRVSSRGAAPSSLTRDPRGEAGLDGGVHAWLEDGAGRVHDVAILGELAASVLADEEARVEGPGRSFERSGLRFEYEELPDLEVLHLADAGPWERTALLLAATGELPPGEDMVPCPLRVGWRRARGPAQ